MASGQVWFPRLAPSREGRGIKRVCRRKKKVLPFNTVAVVIPRSKVMAPSFRFSFRSSISLLVCVCRGWWRGKAKKSPFTERSWIDGNLGKKLVVPPMTSTLTKGEESGPRQSKQWRSQQVANGQKRDSSRNNHYLQERRYFLCRYPSESESEIGIERLGR